MNQDVNDLEKGLFRMTVISSDKPKSHILARIRNFNNTAMSSIGSALSGPFSAMGSYVFQGSRTESLGNCTPETWYGLGDLEAALAPASLDHNRNQQSPCHSTYSTVNALNLAPECSSSLPQSSRLLDVKRIIDNLARSYLHNTSIQMHPLESIARQQFENNTYLDASAVPSWEEPLGTPPLTPDSLEDGFHTPVPDDLDYSCDYDDEDSAIEWNRSHSLEIKEGKKPERLQHYDNFVEDDDLGLNSTKLDIAQNRNAMADDKDEWYGLEYTLELSHRERHPSDSKPVGEHSKSRESWAAIHQGTVDPFFEDEDYHRWKNWHRFLDHEDERKRYERSQEFMELSKDLAWLYAEEMQTRDIMYWEKEVYGSVSREVREHLQTLVHHRPDPYLPPKKHNLGWYLKRSRSVACLLELRPLPVLENKADFSGHYDAYLAEPSEYQL